MSLRIYLTGRVAIEVDGRVIVDERRLRGRQGRLVLAYLVCGRTRPASKEELASVIWRHEPAPAWESALSALVSRLSTVLSSAELASRGVSLARGFGQYRILLPTDVWIDLEAAASAIDRAESALRSGRHDQVLGPATVAATVARRPFLSEVSGEWVEARRRRLERQLLRALDCLSEMRLHYGEPGLAVEMATEAVAMDPFRERSHQLLMRAYVADGNPAKALDAYRGLEAILKAELGTGPSPESEAVYRQLLP